MDQINFETTFFSIFGILTGWQFFPSKSNSRAVQTEALVSMWSEEIVQRINGIPYTHTVVKTLLLAL